jgi:acyl carrier protein
MDPITLRLTTCFETVFPDLPVEEIPAASQATLAAWDSVAAITLVNVIEEEFGIEMDFDQLADLDSFRRVRDYLGREVRTEPLG